MTFHTGEWVRWTTENSSKTGQVMSVQGCSMVVEWLGGDKQVFPVIEYVKGMEVVERPPHASSIDRDKSHGVMSVRRAASILGTTPKRVRARLRDGSLTGSQREGKWVSVDLEN